MKLIKSNPGILALIVGFALAISTSAFTSKNAQQWHFKAASTSSDIRDYTAYEPATGSESCDNEQFDLPCLITVDEEGSTALDNYLTSEVSSAQQVIDEADATRGN